MEITFEFLSQIEESDLIQFAAEQGLDLTGKYLPDLIEDLHMESDFAMMAGEDPQVYLRTKIELTEPEAVYPA